MAAKKPKVGDAALIDGVSLSVGAVEPRGKPVVHFYDEDRMALQKLKEEGDREKLLDAPRGVKVSTNIKNIEWIEDVNVWTIRGRLQRGS